MFAHFRKYLRVRKKITHSCDFFQIFWKCLDARITHISAKNTLLNFWWVERSLSRTFEHTIWSGIRMRVAVIFFRFFRNHFITILHTNRMESFSRFFLKVIGVEMEILRKTIFSRISFCTTLQFFRFFWNLLRKFYPPVLWGPKKNSFLSPLWFFPLNRQFRQNEGCVPLISSLAKTTFISPFLAVKKVQTRVKNIERTAKIPEISKYLFGAIP